MLTDKQLQERALNYKKAFIDTLDELYPKIASLEEIQDSNPKLYGDIKTAADALRSALETAVDSYMNNINQSNIKEKTIKFSTDCGLAIHNAKLAFQKHPSIWFKLNPIIRSILGVLSAITVIPALIIGSKYGVSGFSSTFFKTPEHDPNDTLALVERYIFGSEVEGEPLDRSFINDFTFDAYS